MVVYTEKNPNWIDWIVPEKFNDPELFKIVIFFVFHSPCSNLSAMRKSIQEYGWKEPWKKPYYLNKQLKQAASNFNILFSAAGYNAMEEALKKADLYDNFPSDFSKERICIFDSQKNQFLSVFYHIRNAFAHGRLNMVEDNGECVFIFEDIYTVKKKDLHKVSARMIIRKSTLLAWIDLIEGKEKIYIKSADKA